MCQPGSKRAGSPGTHNNRISCHDKKQQQQLTDADTGYLAMTKSNRNNGQMQTQDILLKISCHDKKQLQLVAISNSN
jgi:hypothetical protein